MKMKLSHALVLVLIALTASVGSVFAQQAPDPRVADLVKAGRIRVGLFPPQILKDAKTGELTGVWAETARALAKRIGVQVVISEHPTPVKAAECLKAGLCDAVSASRRPTYNLTSRFWCRLIPKSGASQI